MKKIINRKMYDTETAKEIKTWENGYYPRDYHYYYETLYCKHTGEFFLYGEGGPLSKYAERCGNYRTGGECITPYSTEDAMDWVAMYGNADLYIELFGDVAE